MAVGGVFAGWVKRQKKDERQAANRQNFGGVSDGV
tara:strand:+ start:142 stop:246 length:105 start_codon:yes stop_codon:yes gene_type:complete